MNLQRNKTPEDILNSLDGSQRAAAPDFFYTRLKARMLARAGSGKKYETGNNRSWVLRPAYVLVALFLILIINTAIVLQSDETKDTGTADTETIQQSIASEYSLSDNNSMYDLNAEK